MNNHEENFKKYKENISKLDLQLEKNVKSHQEFLKNNPTNRDSLSNMMKNINNPSPSNLKNPVADLNTNTYVMKSYTKEGFDRKAEEDLIDYHIVKNNYYKFNKNASTGKLKDLSLEDRQVQSHIRMIDVLNY